ncbi:hypothetical protein CAOG_003791 [Capsaspora owczarzaki ATCC 30864]|uniref:Protein translocase subunit SecA n=1 Tax=Capsaspora owczarzaki (strain ATCC 30864) TaxID=595528 RepID=A0A0D2X2P3_CAPO3|nr:hypothetical protein CAOG_003791 [Capsaspora owczarzaki ATCC 30864]
MSQEEHFGGGGGAGGSDDDANNSDDATSNPSFQDHVHRDPAAHPQQQEEGDAAHTTREPVPLAAAAEVRATVTPIASGGGGSRPSNLLLSFAPSSPLTHAALLVYLLQLRTEATAAISACDGLQPGVAAAAAAAAPEASIGSVLSSAVASTAVHAEEVDAAIGICRALSGYSAIAHSQALHHSLPTAEFDAFCSFALSVWTISPNLKGKTLQEPVRYRVLTTTSIMLLWALSHDASPCPSSSATAIASLASAVAKAVSSGELMWEEVREWEHAWGRIGLLLHRQALNLHQSFQELAALVQMAANDVHYSTDPIKSIELLLAQRKRILLAIKKIKGQPSPAAATAAAAAGGLALGEFANDGGDSLLHTVLLRGIETIARLGATHPTQLAAMIKGTPSSADLITLEQLASSAEQRKEQRPFLLEIFKSKTVFPDWQLVHKLAVALAMQLHHPIAVWEGSVLAAYARQIDAAGPSPDWPEAKQVLQNLRTRKEDALLAPAELDALIRAAAAVPPPTDAAVAPLVNVELKYRHLHSKTIDVSIFSQDVCSQTVEHAADWFALVNPTSASTLEALATVCDYIISQRTVAATSTDGGRALDAVFAVMLANSMRTLLPDQRLARTAAIVPVLKRHAKTLLEGTLPTKSVSVFFDTLSTARQQSNAAELAGMQAIFTEFLRQWKAQQSCAAELVQLAVQHAATTAAPDGILLRLGWLVAGDSSSNNRFLGREIVAHRQAGAYLRHLPALYPSSDQAVLGKLAKLCGLDIPMTTAVSESPALADNELIRFALQAKPAPWSAELWIAFVGAASMFWSGDSTARMCMALVDQLVDKLQGQQHVSVVLSAVAAAARQSRRAATLLANGQSAAAPAEAATTAHQQPRAGYDSSLRHWLADFLPLEDVTRGGVSLTTEAITKGAEESMAAPESLLEFAQRVAKLRIHLYELRFPEKSLEQVIEEFEQQMVTLPAAEFKVIVDQFRLIKAQYMRDAVHEWDEARLRAAIRAHRAAIAHADGTGRGGAGLAPDLATRFDLTSLVLIREAIRIHKGYRPYNTQMLVVLSLLATPRKGRLGQVKTGQGKSVVVSMLAATMAMRGHPVDIVTSSVSLARRDAKEMAGFFHLFDLKVTHNTDKNPTHQQNYAAEIVYGDAFHFEHAQLMDSYDFETVRTPRPYGIAIVDEVDSMLIDRASFSTRIIYQSELFYRVQWIYPILLQLSQASPPPSAADMTATVLQSKPFKQCSDFIKEFVQSQLPYWARSAVRARHLQRARDYIVVPEGIKIVDFEHTGEIHENMFHMASLHQLLELREGLRPSLDRLMGCHLSHITLFNKYTRILGLSGTLGDETERKELLAFYDLDTFDVPVHTMGKLDVRSPVITGGRVEWFDSIQAEMLQQAKVGRPVLILFRSIADCNEFHKSCNSLTSGLLAAQDSEGALPIQFQLLNGVQAEEEEAVVSRAGKEGVITLATNMAGRGTDIRTWKRAEANGGTHVILTFFPLNERVQAQAFGRTARQGKQGSVRFVLNTSDLSKHISQLPPPLQAPGAAAADVVAGLAALRLAREQISSQMRLRVHGPLAIWQDSIVDRFCQRMAVWKKNTNYDSHAMDGARAQWVTFFSLLNLAVIAVEAHSDDHTQDAVAKSEGAVKEFIQENETKFTNTINQIQKSLEKGDAIKDPIIMIDKAFGLIDDSSYDEAVSVSSNAIKVDSDYSRAYSALATAYASMPNKQSNAKSAWQKCEAATKRALEIDPTNRAELIMRVLALRALGRGAEANEAQNEAIKALTTKQLTTDLAPPAASSATSPTSSSLNSQTYTDICNVCYKLESVANSGDLRKDLLDRAISLSPTPEWALRLRARWHIKRHEVTMALQDLDRALLCKPTAEQLKFIGMTRNWAYRKQGTIMADAQRYPEAIAWFAGAFQFHPATSGHLVTLSFYHAKAGNKALAYTIACDAVRLNPNDDDAYVNRGAYGAAAGVPVHQRRADFLKALQLNPKNELARSNLRSLN